MKTTEIRDPQGGRNFIRYGDKVRVKPKGRNSWIGEFHYATLNEAGELVSLTIWGGPPGHAMWHEVWPAQVFRVAQTRNGEAVR